MELGKADHRVTICVSKTKFRWYQDKLQCKQTDQLGCGPVVFVEANRQINWGAAPWFLLKQKSRQCRDLENNPRIYEHVADGGRNMLSCVRMSGKHNAISVLDFMRNRSE